MTIVNNESREYVNCNLCGSNDYSILFNKQDDAMVEFNNKWKESHYDIYKDDTTFTTVMCDKCGLVYVNPRLKSEILGYFYEQYLPEEQESNDEMRKFTFAKHIEKIKQYHKTGRLLDIGCANSYFLNMAKTEGYEVEGVEKSQSCCEYAKKTFNVNVFNGDFLSQDFTSKGFDIVCLFHSLEHVEYPFETLQKVYKIMNDQGIIVIDVPNVNRAFNVKITKNLWGASCEGHLYAFSTFTLKSMVAKAGFTVIGVETNRLPYNCWEDGSTVLTFLFARFGFLNYLRTKRPPCSANDQKLKVAEIKKTRSTLKKLYHNLIVSPLIYLEETFYKGVQITLIAQKLNNL